MLESLFSPSNIIGTIASICLILGYMPQAIHTMRTRDTDGIALPTFLMTGLGSIFFAIQGLLTDNWPLLITNVITTISRKTGKNNPYGFDLASSGIQMMPFF